MKKLIYSLSAATLIVTLFSCGSKDKPAQAAMPPVAVSTATAKLGDATYFEEYPAAVTPLKQLDIVAMANGYVTGIFFTDGQKVKKGQKLYQIDQDQYQAGIDQAQADLNTAIANEKRAQKDADRYIELDKNDAIARQVLDNALAALEAAQMQVKGARAAVERSRVGLRYSSITAPFSGTMGISLVRTGALVSSGQTLLNTLSTDDPMAVDVPVGQKEIPRFTQLLNARPSASDSLFSLVLPDGSLYAYHGRIELLDRAVNPQTGTIKARFVFANPQGMLKAGMAASLRMKSSSAEKSLLIPYKSVVEQMGEYFVYLVQGDSVVQRNVTLGARISDRVTVRSGLDASAEIVTEGVQKLRNGSRISRNQ